MINNNISSHINSNSSNELSPTLVQHRIPTKERFQYILDEPIPIPTPQVSMMNKNFTYENLQEYIEGYAILYTHQLAMYYRAGQIERSNLLDLLDMIFFDKKGIASQYYIEKLDSNARIQTKISLLQPLDTLMNEIMLLGGYIQFIKAKGYSKRKQTGLDIHSFIYFDDGIEDEKSKLLLDLSRSSFEINLKIEYNCNINNNNSSSNNNSNNYNNNYNSHNSNNEQPPLSPSFLPTPSNKDTDGDEEMAPYTTTTKVYKIPLSQSMEAYNTRGVVPHNYVMARMFPDHSNYSFYSTTAACNMLSPKYRQYLSEFLYEFLSSQITITCNSSNSIDITNTLINNINNNNNNINNNNNNNQSTSTTTNSINNNNNNNLNNINTSQHHHSSSIELILNRGDLNNPEFQHLLDFMIGELYRSFYENYQVVKKNKSESLLHSITSFITPLIFYFIYNQPNKFNFK